MSEQPQKPRTTIAFALSVAVTTLIGVAVIFGIKYSETKRERDALLFEQAMKQHDEQLMEGQKEYTLREINAHNLERTRAQRAKEQDVPEGVLAAEDRNAVDGSSSGPGLPADDTISQ
jgi:hypothetical protein